MLQERKTTMKPTRPVTGYRCLRTILRVSEWTLAVAGFVATSGMHVWAQQSPDSAKAASQAAPPAKPDPATLRKLHEAAVSHATKGPKVANTAAFTTGKFGEAITELEAEKRLVAAERAQIMGPTNTNSAVKQRVRTVPPFQPRRPAATLASPRKARRLLSTLTGQTPTPIRTPMPRLRKGRRL
jgi:hypothetical protein